MGQWGGGGGQLPSLEFRQSDYNALIIVISAPPEIRETISALPHCSKTSRYGTAVLLCLFGITTIYTRAVPSGGGQGGQLPPQRFDKVTITLLEVSSLPPQ